MRDLQQLIRSLRAPAATDPAECARLDADAQERWAYSAGLQLWLFGLPLLRFEAMRRQMAALPGPLDTLPFAPLNQVGHMRVLPTAESALPFTPNVDTLYSGMFLDLSSGPLVLEIGPIARYWSVQITSAFLSNLPYLGSRATGDQGGRWLLAGPNWHGEVPPGLELRRFPTDGGIAALRVRIEGPHDLSEVHRLQDGMHLSTLADHLAGLRRPAPPGRAPQVPPDAHELATFTTLSRLLAHDPPGPEDASIVALIQQLGLLPGVSPDDLDPAVRRGLARAAADGPAVLAWKVKHRGRRSPSGWRVDLTGGSYGCDYLARAEGALQGLLVHDAEECVYFHTYEDRDGAPLDGGRSYTLRFAPGQLAQTAPRGFWSFTGYNPQFLLIPHPSGRYSVQSSDPGVIVDADGGLTMHTGPTPPAGRVRNWVGTVPGETFRLNYRVYLPVGGITDPERVDELLPPMVPVPG